MIEGRAIRRAVILSAGKGSRLLPLTEDRPKCLIDFSGRTLLEWQLDALEAAGVARVDIVTGFKPDMVDEVIAGRSGVSTIFNPFYHVADNLGSVWMARRSFDEDLLLLNGDTLVPPDLVARVIAAPAAPIRVTIDEKEDYDDDDMKVLRDGDRLIRIGKKLPTGGYNAESIGVLRFQGEGRRAFIDAVEAIMRTPAGTADFYLRVIDLLADTGIVHTTSIRGIAWQEVDFAPDVEAARALTAGWARDLAPGGGPFRAQPRA